MNVFDHGSLKRSQEKWKNDVRILLLKSIIGLIVGTIIFFTPLQKKLCAFMTSYLPLLGMSFLLAVEISLSILFWCVFFSYLSFRNRKRYDLVTGRFWSLHKTFILQALGGFVGISFLFSFAIFVFSPHLYSIISVLPMLLFLVNRSLGKFPYQSKKPEETKWKEKIESVVEQTKEKERPEIKVIEATTLPPNLYAFSVKGSIFLSPIVLKSHSTQELKVLFYHEFHHAKHSLRESLLGTLLPEYLAFIPMSFLTVETLDHIGTWLDIPSYWIHPELALPPALFLIAVYWGLWKTVMGNYLTRVFERQADTFALKHNTKEAYISLFEKHQRLHLEHPDPPAWYTALKLHWLALLIVTMSNYSRKKKNYFSQGNLVSLSSTLSNLSIFVPVTVKLTAYS